MEQVMNRAMDWMGARMLRALLGTGALLALNAALAAAEQTPQQASTLKILGLGLGIYISAEALAGLGESSFAEFGHAVRALRPLFQAGPLGVFAGLTAVTVLTFNVGVIVVAGVLLVGGIAVMSHELRQAFQERRAMQQPPAPPETIPSPLPEVPPDVPPDVPPTRPFLGWKAAPDAIPGCTPAGAWFCWVPVPWWEWQPHWPRNVFLIPGDCSATPACLERWPSGIPFQDLAPLMLMAELAEEEMLLAEAEQVPLLELDVLIGPDGALRGVATRDRGWSPAWDAWLVEAVDRWKDPGDPSLRLGNPYDREYVASVLGTTPGTAVPLPATLLMLVTGAAVAWRLRRRITR